MAAQTLEDTNTRVGHDVFELPGVMPVPDDSATGMLAVLQKITRHLLERASQRLRKFLREPCLNACVHQAQAEGYPVRVIHFFDRLWGLEEFYSPGLDRRVGYR